MLGLTTLPLSCANCLKPESLNLLEPSGNVQACTRTAFTLSFYGLFMYVETDVWQLGKISQTENRTHVAMKKLHIGEIRNL